LKGGGGGASAQRGSGLIKWVKAVLVVHTAHLMNIPDLVTRLSGLHATLTSRLLLQDRLLTLNGRLDLVLSQIDLRTAPSEPVAQGPSKKGKKPKKSAVTKYVEGESSDEEDEAMDMDVEVQIESGDEEGSVEDIELGGESDEDESGEDLDEDDEDDDDHEDTDEDGGSLNGFIDDEAEESYGEDESEEDDED